MTRHPRSLSIAIGMALTGSLSFAAAPYHSDFSQFTPLAASAGPTIYEGKPITFGNPDLQQVTIASFNAQFDDMPRRVPDLTRVRTAIGFHPRLNLDQIIQSVLEDQRRELELSRG